MSDLPDLPGTSAKLVLALLERGNLLRWPSACCRPSALMTVCADCLATLRMVPRPAVGIHFCSWCWYAGFGYITWSPTRCNVMWTRQQEITMSIVKQVNMPVPGSKRTETAHHEKRLPAHSTHKSETSRTKLNTATVSSCACSKASDHARAWLEAHRNSTSHREKWLPTHSTHTSETSRTKLDTATGSYCVYCKASDPARAWIEDHSNSTSWEMAANTLNAQERSKPN